LPLQWATLVAALLLALAAPAHAQAPGPYVKYRVEIAAPLALADALRAGLDLYRWQGYETMTPELLRRLMTEAEAETRDILAANGYFSPEVSATLDAAAEPQVVRLAVEPGEPTRVTGVDIRLTGAVADDGAQEDALLARVRADWLLPVGAVFTQVDWDRTKRRAVEIVSERLYAGARIAASEARIDPELRTATLAVTIDSGPALRFGALRITGTARHDEARVSNLWTFAPGEPYDREKLERYQRRLVATGYFASVQVEVDPAAAEGGEVPVRVSVIEGPRRRLELSLGYSTDTKFRGGVDWRNNDIFARDWRLRLNANLETVQQWAEAAVDLPERPSGWADTVGVRWKSTDIENLETDEWRVGVRTTAVEERSAPRTSPRGRRRRASRPRTCTRRSSTTCTPGARPTTCSRRAAAWSRSPSSAAGSPASPRRASAESSGGSPGSCRSASRTSSRSAPRPAPCSRPRATAFRSRSSSAPAARRRSAATTSNRWASRRARPRWAGATSRS
jgi:translocation and assembly module TamA